MVTLTFSDDVWFPDEERTEELSGAFLSPGRSVLCLVIMGRPGRLAVGRALTFHDFCVLEGVYFPWHYYDRDIIARNMA